MSKKLSIVIPCYNEEKSISQLVEKCKSILADEIEIVLVDNGSRDETYNKLIEFTKDTGIVVLKLETNSGYGNGILQGLYKSGGQIVSWTHADLQTDPKDAVLAFEKYKNGLISKSCAVKGKRRNRNVFDAFFTFGMSVISSLSLRVKLENVNAQPKIFHSDFLKEFENPPLDFSLDLYVLYFFRKRNIPIKNYPVYFNKRQFGEAKGGGTLKGKFKLIKRTFKYILKLRRDLRMK